MVAMMDVARVESVSKIYRRNRATASIHALRELSLSVPRGQYLAIMGPSGSGKSTLMNILGCLDRPTSGRYLLEGRDVAALDDESLSRVRGQHIGFVFQAFNLIPQLTVQANVEVPLFYQGLGPALRHRQASEAIDRVKLGDRAHHVPSALSGGQQQRAAIARALVASPSILLADEPTGNLDSTTGAAILELFDELHDQGLTVIVVTHDAEIGDRCQRIIKLKDGMIDRDVIN